MQRYTVTRGQTHIQQPEAEPQRPPLQRAAVSTAPDHGVPPIVHDVLAAPGQPLDAATRAKLEPRFGHDFSRVRVHTGLPAAESARAVGALAYTVGQHVVFGAGQYAPGTAAGGQLIAHELTHVVQQRGVAGPLQATPAVSTPGDAGEREAEHVAGRIMAGERVPRINAMPARLMRRWDPPPPDGCPAVELSTWLNKVVVEQEMPQSVTLHWSDGRVTASIASTGKGHCCAGESNPEAATCSVAESRRTGSNCTPITEGAEYPIANRYLDNNGWKFWSDFVPRRGIGLHQHHTVTGTPLSHGCVRLPEETARTIYCGARQNRTRVEVRGFARPNCAEPEVQAEWRSDFRSAGAMPSDGERPDVRRIILQNRAESREMLGEAYGRELTEEEIARGRQGQLALPRCTTTGAEPSTEERRALPEVGAGANVPTDANVLLARSGLEPRIPALTRALAGVRNVVQARRVVQRHGQGLWDAATRRAQSRTGDTDDRPLYWARLAMTRALRQWQPGFNLSAADRQALVERFERSSRGMTDISFGRRSERKRILISGFDPFGFDLDLYGRTGATNPSGAAALALDGQTIRNGSISGLVQSVTFPVRYADFDAGIVENLFRPYLSGPNDVDMIMTISMGLPGSSFEVEEYAGRRRQPGTEDNAGVSAGRLAPPPGIGPGPQFLRTRLPASARASLGRTQPNEQEAELTEIPAGGGPARRRLTGPTPSSTAVEGSGGGFLSNEIFYRVRLLQTASRSTIPAGHLHTPFLSPGVQGLTSGQFEARRDRLARQIRSILEATLPDL